MNLVFINKWNLANTTRVCMIALHQTTSISNQFWELSR